MSLKPIHLQLTAGSTRRKATVWSEADPQAFVARRAPEDTRYLCQFRLWRDGGEVALHADIDGSRWPFSWLFDRCVAELNMLASGNLRGARVTERRAALVSLPFPDRASGFDDVALYRHSPTDVPVMLVEVPRDPDGMRRFAAAMDEAGCTHVRMDGAGIPTGGGDRALPRRLHPSRA